ncbi:beta-ketoacyl synthase N-terminal-like domain-containing protein [Aliikangiella sp. IMCC44359]|uniref:beta-ketoacyl synthase N-terminal-like domain-containing protein n=1 Tax=Aliikangiella sp. IMCC44359 TaxID=3459125 RepID=UPI00403AFD88
MQRDIAIVGIACRFPDATDYNEFWHNLENEKISIKEIPKNRWDNERYYSADPYAEKKSISKWAGLLEQINSFDHEFFNLTTRESQTMDPQHRILLEEVWHCVEDSGIPLTELQNKVTSTFVGMMSVDYMQSMENSSQEINLDNQLGNYLCGSSNRISHLMGFSGKSFTLDTACSSSSSAVHEAKNALISGECDYAIAAGVKIISNPFQYISYSKARWVSPTGACKVFDQNADGFVLGEGVGVFLLQRIDDALKEKNNIHGVIKASAVNHSGKRSLSLSSPSIEAQQAVIFDAYQEAGISPETVSYAEAQSVGSAVADSIEIEALSRAFNQYTNKQQFCDIGSVKPNIGHIESAAGMSAMIKVLMMMKHEKVVKSLNINNPNPLINFKNSPFILSQKKKQWKRVNGNPLRASISSLGFTGTNTHILLEESPVLKSESDQQKNNVNCNLLFFLSAKNKKAFEQLCRSWKKFVQSVSYQKLSLRDLCLTQMFSRQGYEYRWSCLVSSKDELTEKINSVDILNIKETAALSIYYSWNKWLWNSFSQVENYVEKSTLFQQSLTEVVEQLECEGYSLTSSFYHEKWNDKQLPIFNFIIHYSFFLTLKRLGIEPTIVSSYNQASWVGLAIAEIITLSDIIKILNGDIQLSEIVLNRPKIKFYDPVSQQIIQPFQFSATYFSALLSDLVIEDSVLQHYINMARYLFEKQYNFKRYLLSWSQCFTKYGFDLLKVFHDDSETQHFVQGFIHRQLLLQLILTTCVVQFNQKWGLTEPKVTEDKRFYEILNLILKKIMSVELVFDLLFSNKSDLDSISSSLNQQSHFNFASNFYFDQDLGEIKNSTEWIESLLSFEQFNETSVSLVVSKKENINCLLNSTILENQTNNDSLISLLETLWSRGINIKWQMFFDNIKYKKVSLPLYPFQTYCHWFTTEDVKKNDKTSMTEVKSKGDAVEAVASNTKTTSKRDFFKLTELQLSYLFGRVSSTYDKNGCASQIYQEFNAENIDVARLERGWNQVIVEHEMLRVIIQHDGTMKVDESKKNYSVKFYDFSEQSQLKLKQRRENIIHQAFPIGTWPLFELSVTKINNQHFRIHLLIDLLIADGRSIRMLYEQLFQYYRNPQLYIKNSALSLETYQMLLQEAESTDEFKQATLFWEKRFKNIVSGPMFDFVSRDYQVKSSHKRVSGVLKSWGIVKGKALRLGVKPNIVLLCCYAEVLSTWNKHLPLTIVLVNWQRHNIHSDINKNIGDFTSLCWYSTSGNDQRPFIERLYDAQKNIELDFKHNIKSGISHLSKESRKRDLSFPIVMTDIFDGLSNENHKIFKEGYGISQTSHVLLDSLYVDYGESLFFHWDYVENFIPTNILQKMFSDYDKLLDSLADGYQGF